MDPLTKKRTILNKKIDASIQESEMFEEHILEIEE